MNITAESYGHTVTLNLKGELTEDSLSAFQQAIEHHISSPDVIDLVINLKDVPFLDSASLEYLTDLQGRLAERLGQVKLANPDENVRKILEITRLEATFEIFDKVQEAIIASQA